MKTKEVKKDLEQVFLTLWEEDKGSLLEELITFPLRFFTDRELTITEKATPIGYAHVSYYYKKPIITFKDSELKDRVFMVNLIYDFEGVISEVKSVREVPIDKIL